MSRLSLDIRREKMANGSYFTIVKLSGMVDYEPDLSIFSEAFMAISDIQIIVDMSELIYISSSGVSILVQVANNLQNCGGDLKLIHIAPKVKVVFDMVGCEKFFPIFSSLEEAIEFL